LSQREASSQDQRTLSDILRYINDLYTVYTNLFVYDKNGKVLAVSNPSEEKLVGTTLEQEWVKNTLSIRDSQQYSVSKFESTDLYNNRYTYIYGASITANSISSEVVGGIGIVFDSEPEFTQMLADTLMSEDDSAHLANGFAVFVDRKGLVISSTSDRFITGEMLNMSEDVFGYDNGESLSKIIELDGSYYAVGVSTSAGYREYKSDTDKYENDVIALVFMLLGEISDTKTNHKKKNSEIMSLTSKAYDDVGENEELATFYVQDNWLAFRCAQIVEAIGVEHLSIHHESASVLAGKTRYKDNLVPVLNLGNALDGSSGKGQLEGNQIVIVNTHKGMMGVLVDSLGDIPEISLDRFTDMNKVMTGQAQFIDSVVRPGDEDNRSSMLIVLAPDKLLNLVLSGDTSTINEVLKELN